MEAVFEGEKEKVRLLLDFCKHGPIGARVTKVDFTWEPYTGTFDGFRVKHG